MPVVEMKLTPVVEDGRTVRLEPELGTIQADGSLGELLRTGPIEQMLRDKMSHALLSATEKGTNFSETLPPAAQGFATVRMRASRIPVTAVWPWFWMERSTSIPTRHNRSKTNCKSAPCKHDNTFLQISPPSLWWVRQQISCSTATDSTHTPPAMETLTSNRYWSMSS